MSALDWLVLFGTLSAIVAYGVWKTRHPQGSATFMHGGYADNCLPWAWWLWASSRELDLPKLSAECIASRP